MAERGNDVHGRGNRGVLEQERRRRFLLQALSSGLLVGGAGWNLPALAALFGKLPSKMPEGKSIFELKGDVRVDGQPATHDTVVTAGSKIETGNDSYAIVAVGDGAFILRDRTLLQLGGQHLLVRSLQVLNGALLSVFGVQGNAASAARDGFRRGRKT